MLEQKTIAVVIPCYNEGTQIGKVIDTMPDIVDRLVIVDDNSDDNTVELVEAYKQKLDKIVLIRHSTNQGCGGALASGYKWARDNDIDVAVRMDGDGQMSPDDLNAIVEPVASGDVDYSKGNRLFTGEAYRTIPKIRYFGNSVLSMFTKIASGYWHVADSQTGYTAIGRKGLHMIDWDKMYKSYGQPNDLLVRLNVFDLKVRDVPVKPVYNVGEKSGINIGKVIFTIPLLLLRLFLWRMKEKYIIRNFHPLVFFYCLGFIFLLLTLFLAVRLVVVWIDLGHAPAMTSLALVFSFMSANLFSLFAMWFDMETNKDLK
ncbi:MAG TPA: glycosyltransferase family 2 protein [Flavobacteriales bacterium]|nr:glycosyltransferase family 2 protein [Flavobacteriales bacterium]